MLGSLIFGGIFIEYFLLRIKCIIWKWNENVLSP